MEIICCRSTEEAAEKAFRLRYKVYGAELHVDAPGIDHQKQTYIDQSDGESRIYVAIKDGEAVATCRTLYDRDCHFPDHFTKPLFQSLGIRTFLQDRPGTLALSTKFAISPSHRGSLAAHLITARMFEDLVEDGIEFVFSWCAPYLFTFYTKLGFHMYSHAVSDHNGFWTPIVLPVRDWKHLQSLRSPLFKHLEKRQLCQGAHPSVTWFHDHFDSSLDEFVSEYEDSVLDKIFLLSRHYAQSHDLQDISIFNSMTREELKSVIEADKVLHFLAGEEIIRTGQLQDEMFMVIDGEVDVILDEGSSLVAKLRPGQVFGEIAMLTRTTRTASCRAATDVQLAFLSRQGLSRLMKVEPDLAARLLYNLSKSLSLKLLRTNGMLRKPHAAG